MLEKVAAKRNKYDRMTFMPRAVALHISGDGDNLQFGFRHGKPRAPGASEVHELMIEDEDAPGAGDPQPDLPEEQAEGAGSPAKGQGAPGTMNGSDLQAYIGRGLRAVFDDVARQPIPDRFLELMKKLD